MTLSNDSHNAEETASNVYLLGLELRDVRCFEGTHYLDLTNGKGSPARWTLILGENGVGKTTLLELLESLRPAPLEHRGSRLHSVSALLQMRGIEDAFYTFRRADSLRWSFDIRVTRGESLSSPASTDPEIHRCSGWVAGDGSQGTLLPPDVVVTTYGYGASRRVSGGASLSGGGINDASVLLTEADNLQSPERWFLDATLSATQASPLQARAKEQLAKIEALLVRVLPDVTGVRVGIVDRAGELTPRLQVEGPDGWVAYSALGVGYRTTMAWMIDLAIRLFNRYPTLPNPLAGAAICLVDEIDLHLHPRWQRTLMRTLAELFPNVQFVATAHSPLMVQAASETNVAVLRRQAGRVVIDNDPPKVEKWRVDQILTSDLFGLPSARAPELDDAIARRNELLSKPHLTDEDEAELATLSKYIGSIPYGETPEDIEASNTIRLAARKLTEGR